jgi:hypothetical protein
MLAPGGSLFTISVAINCDKRTAEVVRLPEVTFTTRVSVE